jgi:predicted GNAT family N-acyltransferase
VTDVAVRPVSVQTVRPLRHRVLRGPDAPMQASVYPVDELPTTLHLGCFADERLVGCVTLFPESRGGRPAWRLRGMAVEPSEQARGYGSRLVVAGLQHARAASLELVWCNARTSVLPFYAGHGFVAVGEEFITAGGIPHVVAERHLGDVAQSDGNSTTS